MDNSSYKSIIKSTGIIGGSQVIKVFLGIIKNKILAILIGPAGLGLIGAYNNAIGLISTFAGLGIGFSGVRQVAEADATNDNIKLSKTVFTLKRLSVYLGLFGALIFTSFSTQISLFTFGNKEHTIGISILSLSILFNIYSNVRISIIQGKRLVKNLAKLSVYGSLISTTLSIPIIYFYDLNGVIPFLILFNLSNAIIARRYSDKIELEKVTLKLKEYYYLSKDIIKLGIAFMSGGLLTTATNYLITVIVIREINISALGLYQAAATISTVYISIILDAMGKDYFPRLTALTNNDKESIKLINEQTEVGLLFSIPGIIFTLTFAPLIIVPLYSNAFINAYPILQWQILGVFLRVVFWPMGFLFIARGKGLLFFLVDIFTNIINITFVWIGVKFYGVVGTGIAFFITYFFYSLIVLVINKNLINFKWSKENQKLFALIFPSLGITFIATFFFNRVYSTVLGSLVLIWITFFSVKKILIILKLDNLRSLIIILKTKLLNKKNNADDLF